MREIHFFEKRDDEDDWILIQEMKDIFVWVANDFASMKDIVDHFSEVRECIATTQMCYLDTMWFDDGYKIFVHDHTGTFEIVLGEGNERTSRHIRYGHNLYRMWTNGEFGSKEGSE